MSPVIKTNVSTILIALLMPLCAIAGPYRPQRKTVPEISPKLIRISRSGLECGLCAWTRGLSGVDSGAFRELLRYAAG